MEWSVAVSMPVMGGEAETPVSDALRAMEDDGSGYLGFNMCSTREQGASTLQPLMSVEAANEESAVRIATDHAVKAARDAGYVVSGPHWVIYPRESVPPLPVWVNAVKSTTSAG